MLTRLWEIRIWNGKLRINIILELKENFSISRVSVTMDVYLEKTSSLLSSLELPYSNGFDSYTENIGAVENKGFELAAQPLAVAGHGEKSDVVCYWKFIL